MSNVFLMERDSAYWVARAKKHRLAGRYDEAMVLLSKTKADFGTDEALEMELACVYDEMDRSEEAVRAYLRVVRFNGAFRAEALFLLALSYAQQGELVRAESYLSRFERAEGMQAFAQEGALLRRQIEDAQNGNRGRSKKQRAAKLEQRAVQNMQFGKIHAARRTLEHAQALYPRAQRLTLLACCDLAEQRYREACEKAVQAHRAAPGRVQTLCVLIDTLYADGQVQQAKRMLHIGLLRAQSPDELLGVAIESAKHGEDAVTLQLTGTMLRRDPFHTRAMLLRSCALINADRMDEASRLLGRLSRLLPEDTVCEALYHMARQGEKPKERLTLGTEVPDETVVSRVVRLISALYGDVKALSGDVQENRVLCRLGAWALRSAAAGKDAAFAALVLLNELDTPLAREVLLDALTDPQIADDFKCTVLRVMTAKHGFLPLDADIGGRFVRLAAGGATGPNRISEQGRAVIQTACNALMADFPQAPTKLLPIYLRYVEKYGLPRGRKRNACVSALQALYHRMENHHADEEKIAKQNGVSLRTMRAFVRRLERVADQKSDKTEEKG